jgi:low affinity Fe/Cu permease
VKRYPLGDRGLAIVLGAAFLGSWAAQAIFQLVVEDETWGAFWAATMENWQSEFLQLLTFLTLTSILIFKGSPESRDSDDEMDAKLDEILRRLDER